MFSYNSYIVCFAQLFFAEEMLGHTLFLFEIIHFLPSPAILADIVYIIYIVYNVYNLQSRMAKCWMSAKAFSTFAQ